MLRGLVAAAKKQGYRVYLEATLEQSAAVAEAGANSGAAGVVLKGSAAAESQLEESAGKLRAKYPKLKILVVSAGGKQPEMRGWLVFQKNGMLQVSSPTSQPWLDAESGDGAARTGISNGASAAVYVFVGSERPAGQREWT